MSVAVNLADSVQSITQSLTIGGESTDGQDDGSVLLGSSSAANLEDLGGHSGVDAVAAGVTSIAGHDGKVGTGDGKRRATIVGVAEGMVNALQTSNQGSRGSLRIEAVLSRLSMSRFGCI